MTPEAARVLRLPRTVRVVRCSHPSYWWATEIGQAFTALLYRPDMDDFVLENGDAVLASDVEDAAG